MSGGRELEGRAGIITGAGSGIGAAIALELAGRGARLVLGDIALEAARRVAGQVHAGGGTAVAIAADVRRFEAAAALAQACQEQLGAIDFAIANAGIGDVSSVADGDPARWRDVIETNVLGVAYLARAVLPAMRQRRQGHLVIMASVSGRETYVGEPIYIASKWAVVGLGRALRKEALHYGVRVTLIEPGLVDTPLARSTTVGQEWLQRLDPLRPEDVARAVGFALQQPAHVAVNEIVVQPLAQEI